MVSPNNLEPACYHFELVLLKSICPFGQLILSLVQTYLVKSE